MIKRFWIWLFCKVYGGDLVPIPRSAARILDEVAEYCEELETSMPGHVSGMLKRNAALGYFSKKYDGMKLRDIALAIEVALYVKPRSK